MDSVSIHFGSKLSRTVKGSSCTMATIHVICAATLPIPLFTYHINFFLLQRQSNWLSGDTLLHEINQLYAADSLRTQGSFVWSNLQASILRFRLVERTKNAFHSCRPHGFALYYSEIDCSMSRDQGNGIATIR